MGCVKEELLEANTMFIDQDLIAAIDWPTWSFSNLGGGVGPAFVRAVEGEVSGVVR